MSSEFTEFQIFFRLADPTFGINKQAMAILAYISASEISECQPPEVIHTFPMKFGEKIGVCLMFKKHDTVVDPWLLVFVGEDDQSERIIVKHRTVRALNTPFIGPTYQDFQGAQTEFFIEGDILSAHSAITNALLSYML